MTHSASVQEVSLAATGETPEIADPTQCAPAGEAAAESPSTSELQEVLPAIKDLAARVGGLDRLAELVATLRTAKE
jgi:hypothetical protein